MACECTRLRATQAVASSACINPQQLGAGGVNICGGRVSPFHTSVSHLIWCGPHSEFPFKVISVGAFWCQEMVLICSRCWRSLQFWWMFLFQILSLQRWIFYTLAGAGKVCWSRQNWSLYRPMPGKIPLQLRGTILLKANFTSCSFKTVLPNWEKSLSLISSGKEKQSIRCNFFNVWAMRQVGCRLDLKKLRRFAWIALIYRAISFPSHSFNKRIPGMKFGMRKRWCEQYKNFNRLVQKLAVT